MRASTAAVVLAVAGVAAYISYWHAYAVVREYGESGVTALLEPATIDGLVYASSMVILYAARHRLPVPRLARWMLALGIAASLAVNVAQGWSHGVVGAVVAAWPAVALVGSYELLAWMIRTAAARAADHEPEADQHVPGADHPEPRHQPEVTPLGEPSGAVPPKCGASRLSDDAPGPDHVVRPADLVRRPGTNGREKANHAEKPNRGVPDRADHGGGSPGRGDAPGTVSINVAAVAAYRASVLEGMPLSERRLAEAFGTTSRRWARHRMAEARENALLG
ncbi:DUF2637 domain-containing protein [Trebonia kvetii]|uniref:DUF2637 domain-containing protein n=1 Tax=Trebonia kvetii TaxID=2480626 RepID=A0A6P2BKT3_9ACTN|nr:DUF2637 domain-containing protein [Trebonia kvetii]